MPAFSRRIPIGTGSSPTLRWNLVIRPTIQSAPAAFDAVGSAVIPAIAETKASESTTGSIAGVVGEINLPAVVIGSGTTLADADEPRRRDVGKHTQPESSRKHPRWRKGEVHLVQDLRIHLVEVPARRRCRLAGCQGWRTRNGKFVPGLTTVSLYPARCQPRLKSHSTRGPGLETPSPCSIAVTGRYCFQLTPTGCPILGATDRETWCDSLAPRSGWFSSGGGPGSSCAEDLARRPLRFVWRGVRLPAGRRGGCPLLPRRRWCRSTRAAGRRSL